MARPFGLGYLVFVGVVGSVAGLYLFAPDVPRGWFGRPTPPADEGPAPVLPGNMQVNLEAKDHEAALQTTVRLAPRKPVAAPVATQPKPMGASVAVAGATDAKAQELLTEAERQYRGYQWNAAMAAAKQAAALNPSPAIRVRAQDIARLAYPVGTLFGKLGDRDELARNYDTSPGLVSISGGRETTYAVPIQGSDKDSPVVDKDPLGYIATQRKLGKVNFLVRGSKGYIATELTDDKIGTVAAVDQARIRTERLAQAETFRRTLTGATARDPMAWYDLGRFAYQNRLDEYVVDALHQAVLLDANLAQTVREDRAGTLFANMMAHMKNGNKPQAATYMGIIERKYKDTDQGRQARLYYDGKTTELLAMAREAQRKTDEEEARRRDELKKRAAETGDTQLAAIAEAKETKDEEPTETVATVTGTTDEARADQLYEQGYKVYATAIEKGNTPERDKLYGDAIKIFNQCIPLLAKLTEQQTDPAKRESLEAKLVEANKLKFGATKMRRPGH